MQTYYLETLGCSKNQVDSEKMSGLLTSKGYIKTDDLKCADIIIINTCSFIKSAKEEAVDTIFNLNANKKDNAKLFVTGCFVQQHHEAILEEIPEIDGVMGVGDITKIIDLIEGKQKVMTPDFSDDTLVNRVIENFPGWAYLKISDGCSNCCTYCTIPIIRGKLRSRKIEDIIEEVKFLNTKQIKELILISQDTANYGIDLYGKQTLPKLIKSISDNINEDCVIRVLYMHPDHIDLNLLRELKSLDKFLPYFDIPFQSGADSIIKMMGRKNTSSDNLELISNIRSLFEKSSIRSTFIAGFPGETEKDHFETLDFIKKASLDWVGGFTYSREEGTAAYNFKNRIPAKLMKKRLNSILDAAEDISIKQLSRLVGTEQKVLIEEQVQNETLYIGRLWNQAPEVDGLTVVEGEDLTPGIFCSVIIKKLNGKDYFAVIT